MARMTGGQALARSLLVEGVDTVFALPGVQLDYAFDGLWEIRDRVRVLHTRHEQAAAYMADGYARTTGRPGVCLVVPGPGLLNTTAALSTAYACNSPVLCLTGQIRSDRIGLGGGELHEIADQPQAVAPLTKLVARAESAADVPRVLHRALRALGSGRARPAVVELPPDVLEQVDEVTLPEPELVSRAPAADPDLLDEAARLLGRAERPLIWAGGGVLGAAAWEELRALAEQLEAPVWMTANGRGAISDRHHLAQHGQVAGHALLPGADVVLAVGTRLRQPAFSQWGVRGEEWTLRPDQRVIHLDVDAEEIGRNVEPAVALVADAKEALAALGEAVARYNRPRLSRERELRAVQRAAAERAAAVSVQARFALAIRDALPDDGILVNESTQVGYWAREGFPVYEPRSFLTSGYQGTLGYGYATALGAQVGAQQESPGRRVVSLNGDGGFLYTVQELATAAQHGIPVVAVVFNDGAYGNVRRIQQERYGGHVLGSELRNPDFVRLGRAFGVTSRRVRSPRGLRNALREALAEDAPALIEVPLPPATELPPVIEMAPLPPRPALPPP